MTDKPKTPCELAGAMVLPWECTVALKTTHHGSFEDAFRAMYDKLIATPINVQMLETTVWLKYKHSPLPMMFDEVKDRAYKCGLLKDGKPTWQNAEVSDGV